MLHGLRNRQSALDISIQHRLDQIDIALAHDPRDAELVIQDLVDAVEGVFLVDESVEEDAEGPDVLLFAAIGFSLENFWGCVIYSRKKK